MTGLRKITSTSSRSPRWVVATTNSPEEKAPYDHVIIAAPFASSRITILGSSADSTLLQPPVDYVHLHVTLLSTNVPYASPEYFNLKEGSVLPSMILTTHDAVRHATSSQLEKGEVEEPEFNSMSIHHEILTEEHGLEKIVKIFSKERLSDEWLERVWAWGDGGKIGWIERKEVCNSSVFES